MNVLSDDQHRGHDTRETPRKQVGTKPRGGREGTANPIMKDVPTRALGKKQKINIRLDYAYWIRTNWGIAKAFRGNWLLMTSILSGSVILLVANYDSAASGTPTTVWNICKIHSQMCYSYTTTRVWSLPATTTPLYAAAALPPHPPRQNLTQNPS